MASRKRSNRSSASSSRSSPVDLRTRLDPIAWRFRGEARQRLAGITLAHGRSVSTPLPDRDEDDAEDWWDDLRTALADRVTQSADHIRFLLNETEDSLLLILIERAEAGLEAGTGEIHSLVTELRSAHGLWLASWAELFNHHRDSLGDMGDRVTAFASWLGSGRTV